MAEELQASAPEGIDPLASAMALAGASRAEADAFLRDQRHHMHEQLKEIGLRLWELRLGVLLRLATALVGLAVAGAAGFMVWNAALSDGLVIESFSVPPDMAQKGFTGDVVATTLQDKLYLVQDAGPSQTKPGRALSGGWGDDIKVEIPETGVSVSEAWRFLRRWLGHEIHVSGEVVHDGDGLAVIVRIDGRHAARYAGSQSGLDGLMLKAAEHVVDRTQPGVYASYLIAADPPRVAEALAAVQRGGADLALPAPDRSRALNALANIYRQFRADDRKAAETYRQAIALQPDDTPITRSNLAGVELVLGHPEAALNTWRVSLDQFIRKASNYYPDTAVVAPALSRGNMAALVGDYAEAARQGGIVLAADRATFQDGDRWIIAAALARQHDGGAVRGWLAQISAPVRPLDVVFRPVRRLRVVAALKQWPQAIALTPAAEQALTQVLHIDVANQLATQLRPWAALARAMTGDIAGAEAVIATTPGDCYDCVRVRGLVATEAKQWGRADYWFAKAVHDAPSIPFAYEDWGRSLLARGQAEAAIEQFKLSNAKGPHFADPLEAWGEALMAENQSHLALAKFAEANKYAPNWGRLHLKWGEALGYAGKNDEAKDQFARASNLDLTAVEKIELEQEAR